VDGVRRACELKDSILSCGISILRLGVRPGGDSGGGLVIDLH